MTIPFRLSVLPSLLFVCISCKKEVHEKPLTQSADSITYVEAVVDTTLKIESADTLEMVMATVSRLNALKEKALNDLQKATKDQGTKIYQAYNINTAFRVDYLNQLQADFLPNYYSYYDNKKKAFVFPDRINGQMRIIKDGGLAYREIGEGYAEIRLQPDHYYTIFKGKVTPDYDYYLKTTAAEESVLAFADAAILISFKEVGDRVLAWEKFITEFPKSDLLAKATENYQRYAKIYLFGLDNTSTFEYSNKTMYEENRVEFKRFIAQNPNSGFTRIVKLFLSKFDSNTSVNDLHKIINKELGIKSNHEPNY